MVFVIDNEFGAKCSCRLQVAGCRFCYSPLTSHVPHLTSHIFSPFALRPLPCALPACRTLPN
jgi:hypothetical protein